MPVLFKKRDKQNSNAYLLMILYKTLIRWRNTKHKSKKYSRHRYIHLKKIESERYEVFIFLYSNSLPRYLFLLQKREIKYAADIMCKSVFVTRPQVPENPHLFLWSNRNRVEASPPVATKHSANNRSRGSFVGLMTARGGFM